MAMKVHELAKELGIPSKELLEKLSKIGVSATSHMSKLTEADMKKIKDAKDSAGFSVDNITVNESVRKASTAKPKPPMGKPIVDTAYLDNKDKKNAKPEPLADSLADSLAESVLAKEKEEKQEKKVKQEKKAEPKVAKKEEAVEVKAEKPAKKTETKEAEAVAKPKESEVKEERKNQPEDMPIDKNNKTDKNEKSEGSSQKKADKAQTRDNRTKDRKDKNDHGDKKGQRNSRNDRGDRDNRDSRDRRDRNDKNDKRNSKGDRFSKDKNDRNDRNDRSRNDRNQKPRKKDADAPELGKLETKNDHRKREDKKKHDKNKERSKFDKLERRSLEKQPRKKHVKAKPAQVEPEIEAEPLPEGTIVLNVPITVAGFCEQTEVSTSKVIMTLMKLGVMANINQTIDEDTLMILASELNLQIAIGNVEQEDEEEGIETFEDDEKDLLPRPPIITVMGHVDHGKTSLLDAIRKTNVTSSESGGITQHIGASEVKINGQKIVCLDTPGHEAFTAMRARGAHVTDIAILVVAADDSVKPQTIESISHAKAAGVPIIVAINKMDKPAANPDKVKQDLAENGILVEDWGGDVICVPVSAKKGEGIKELLEMILLQAEVMELKANPNRLAMGSVIEARLDKSKGSVATLLVTNGTLESGQSIVAGTCSGRIRLMTDFKGRKIKKAGPATAVEILGLTDVPQAGDEFNAVKEDKIAREIAENRKAKLREEVLSRNSSSTLEQLFSQIQEGECKELNLIIKGDVQGSVGALVASLEKLSNPDVKVNIIHTGVGTVTESDVMLAGTSNAIIIGFNVRPSTAVQTMADRDSIQIRTYRVIYDVIDDVENAMKGMLDPEFKEEILGKVEIRNTFKVPGVGIVGGAYVTEGKVVRNAGVRLVRDGIVIHEGKISSLKRFKDDAREVAQGYECGIGIEDYNDIKDGDIIECYHMVEIER